MIDFGLSEEQESLARNAREKLASACSPAVVRAAMASADGLPAPLYAQMGELGWMALAVPEKMGGVGLGTLELCLLFEELGRAAAPGPFLATQLVIHALVEAGTSAQRSRLLPSLMAGTSFATLASREPDGEGVELVVRRSKPGYRLRGTKLFVPEAQVAHTLLVAGRSGGGVSLFLVPADAQGLRIRTLESVDRTRRLAEVVLDDVSVPRTALLGREGTGDRLLARLEDLGALAIAAEALGGAARVLELSVEYSGMREQFGRKIGSFQALQHMAAEMVAEIEPSRSLVWYAAYCFDHRPREAPRAVSIAKARLGDVYPRATRRAVEMHGGIGFTWEHDLHLWFKRSLADAPAFGDPSFHRERIARLDRY
jgi:alkylation response protein AidB-like acyl-CoA dehydrogenase